MLEFDRTTYGDEWTRAERGSFALALLLHLGWLAIMVRPPHSSLKKQNSGEY